MTDESSIEGRMWRRKQRPVLERGRMVMNYGQFANFGELYRAAFAERDPIKKQLFLTEVKNAIDRCCESSARSVSATEKIGASEVAGSPVSFRQVA